MNQRPDISLRREGREFTFRPYSAFGNTFLAGVFAQVDGDLTEQDAQRITQKARELGLIVRED